MQNVNTSHTEKDVVFNWEHNDQPVTFKVDRKHFIQLVCDMCKTEVPLLDVGKKHTCPCCSKELKSEGLNHRAEDYGRWVSYLGRWRCKDNYQILLKDGRVIDFCYPNGNSFYNKGSKLNPPGTESRFDDTDVVAIRLMPDSELKNKFEFKGKIRLENNVEYFHDDFPKRERVVDLNGQYGILI